MASAVIRASSATARSAATSSAATVADSHHCCVGPEHPGGNLQIASIDSTNGHGAIGAACLAHDIEGPAGEWVKRVVDDDRRTMGAMSYCVSILICTRSLWQALALASENDFGTLYRPGCALFEGLGHLKTSEVGDVLERAGRRIERHLDRCGLSGPRGMTST